MSSTSLPIGVAAGFAVLGLACIMIFVWCSCLKCVGSHPQSWKPEKVSPYKNRSHVYPIGLLPAVQSPRDLSREGPTTPPPATGTISPPMQSRLVSLKDRQDALVHRSTSSNDNQEQIVQRMQSVMDDSVRIDLHHQEQKRRAVEATQEKRSRKKQLSSSNIVSQESAGESASDFDF